MKILLLELFRMKEVEVVDAEAMALVGLVMVNEELVPRVVELRLLLIIMLHAVWLSLGNNS